jgi:hypothetical protein
MEEHVFVRLVYPCSLKANYSGVNSIDVMNKAWWGGDVEASLSFDVYAPSIDKIFIRNFNEDYSSTGKPLGDPNNSPSTVIFGSSENVRIHPPKINGDRSFKIPASVKISPDDSHNVAILWIDNPASDKEVNPVLKVGGRTCTDYDKRSFWVKYHLVPITIFGIGCVLFGAVVGVTVKDIFNFTMLPDTNKNILEREIRKILGEKASPKAIRATIQAISLIGNALESSKKSRTKKRKPQNTPSGLQ